MPGRDGTGPAGAGPTAGRRMGWCGGAGRSDDTRSACGWGFGAGRGQGFRRRNRFRGRRVTDFEQKLAELRARIDEIEAPAQGAPRGEHR